MVSFNSVLYASALSVAAADFAGAASAVVSDASTLSDLVTAWSSDQGLVAALGIQSGYAPLSSAVSSLQDAAGSVTQDDITNNVDSILALTTNVSGLLGALSAKAADFQSVGAFSIVTGDINGLSSPAASIVASLLAANSDTALAASLKDNVNGLAAAFSSAISVYSASAVEFSTI